MLRYFKTDLRWLYRPLRWLAAFMTGFVGLMFSLTILMALAGDLAMLNDFVDMESEVLDLGIGAKIGLGLVNAFTLLTLWKLFSSIRAVLIHAEQNQLLKDEAEKALMKLGYSMIMLYLVFLSTDVLFPMLVHPAAVAENPINFLVKFFDLNVLTLLIGMVMLALAGALREGRIVREELRQIV